VWTIHGDDSFENSKGENVKFCPPLLQALSIKGDVPLGILQSCLLGRKWRCVGVERPLAGKLVSNPALESALPTKVNFTQKEWTVFGIAHLHFEDYIMSKINDVVHYFQSAASKFEQWACQSKASEEYKQMTLRMFQKLSERRISTHCDGCHSRNLANWNGKAGSLFV